MKARELSANFGSKADECLKDCHPDYPGLQETSRRHFTGMATPTFVQNDAYLGQQLLEHLSAQIGGAAPAR